MKPYTLGHGEKQHVLVGVIIENEVEKAGLRIKWSLRPHSSSSVSVGGEETPSSTRLLFWAS